MKNLLGIHHGALSVPNLEKSINWYSDKLGFIEDFRYEFPPEMQTKAAIIRLDNLRIELFEVTGAGALPAGRKDVGKDLYEHGIKHIALSVIDIDKARTELESKGVEFVTPTGIVPNSGGARYAFFHDNDGILMELYQQPD